MADEELENLEPVTNKDCESAKLLRILYNNGSPRRCSLPYLRWMLGFLFRADHGAGNLVTEEGRTVLLAIRDDLLQLGLIGWSHPPNEACEIFLSTLGLTFVKKHLAKTDTSLEHPSP